MSAVLFASFTTQVRADATVYWDFDNGFSPSTAVISPGDKVTWWNMDVYGFDVTITVTGFLPFTLSPGDGVYAILNTPGMYSMTSNWDHSGSVVVNIPPSVTITNPLNNAVFSAPATVQIKTSTSANVASVGFWLDSGAGPEFLDYDYDVPFSYGLTNLAAGSYILTATASDGYSEISDSISITVNEVAPVITLSNPRLSGTNLLFDVNGLTTGKTHVLQHSINCAAWTSVSTNIAAGSTCTFTNSMPAGGHFYRVIQLADPAPGI